VYIDLAAVHEDSVDFARNALRPFKGRGGFDSSICASSITESSVHGSGSWAASIIKPMNSMLPYVSSYCSMWNRILVHHIEDHAAVVVILLLWDAAAKSRC
jgi:hypothetical protein